jgi:AICAR transformylase/IMP cyclohydrolase PurH
MRSLTFGDFAVGAGAMSRVEGAELALYRGRAAVTAVIHPGGSKQDDDVSAAADALSMAVVHAMQRHFRH